MITHHKRKKEKKRAVSTKLPRSKMSEPGRSSHIHSFGTGYLYTFTSSPSSLSSGFSLYAASRTVQPHTEERGSLQPSWMSRVSIQYCMWLRTTELAIFAAEFNSRMNAAVIVSSLLRRRFGVLIKHLLPMTKAPWLNTTQHYLIYSSIYSTSN